MMIRVMVMIVLLRGTVFEPAKWASKARTAKEDLRYIAYRIRACDGSSVAAKIEVLVSPARPRTILAANGSISSQGAGFLMPCTDQLITYCARATRSRERRRGPIFEPGKWARFWGTAKEDVRCRLHSLSPTFRPRIRPQNEAHFHNTNSDPGSGRLNRTTAARASRLVSHAGPDA